MWQVLRIFFSLVCGFARWFLLSSFLSFIVRVLRRHDQVANGFSFICIQLDHSSAATVNFIFSLPLPLPLFLSPHVFFSPFVSQSLIPAFQTMLYYAYAN